jgi:hypothetical protein
VVDPEWIDIQVVRNWISTYDHQHGQSCRCAYGTTRTTQHRPNLTTVQANVELFQQPGSLDREENAWQIPTCIRDAIAFTKLLNERYL